MLFIRATSGCTVVILAEGWKMREVVQRFRRKEVEGIGGITETLDDTITTYSLVSGSTVVDPVPGGQHLSTLAEAESKTHIRWDRRKCGCG